MCTSRPSSLRPANHPTMFGSTRDARHAGSQQATAATSVMVRHDAPIIVHRVGWLHAEQQRRDQAVQREGAGEAADERRRR